MPISRRKYILFLLSHIQVDLQTARPADTAESTYINQNDENSTLSVNMLNKPVLAPSPNTRRRNKQESLNTQVRYKI